MNINNFPSHLQNFEENLKLGNFQINCRMNSEIVYWLPHAHRKISVDGSVVNIGRWTLGGITIDNITRLVIFYFLRKQPLRAILCTSTCILQSCTNASVHPRFIGQHLVGLKYGTSYTDLDTNIISLGGLQPTRFLDINETN